MPPKPPQTFSQILDSLLKPLTFASKDNFAHLHTVKGMEHLVESLCKDAAFIPDSRSKHCPHKCETSPAAGGNDKMRQTIDVSGKKAFDEMVLIFKGFDGLSDEAKKERIKRAIEVIEGIKLSPSPLPSPTRGEGDNASKRREGDIAHSPQPSPHPPQAGGEGVIAPSLQSSIPPDLPLKKGGIAPRMGEGKLTPSELAKNLEKLKTPLQYIKGIGPKLGERLAKKGLSTVEDILYYLPIRYEDRRNMKKIAELSHGQNEVATGEVMASGEAFYGRRKLFEAVVTDGTGYLKLKWFNYRSSYMKERYKQGKRLVAYGQVSAFGSQKEMIHPDVEFMEADDDSANLKGIMPVYSHIDSMHQKTIRKLAMGIVEDYAKFAVSGAPEDVVARRGFMGLGEAFLNAHGLIPPHPNPLPRGERERVSSEGEREQKKSLTPTLPHPPQAEGREVIPPAPPLEKEGEKKGTLGKGEESASALAKKSLVFDELFSLELGLALRRKEIKKEGGIVIEQKVNGLEKKLLALLPFELTQAQKRTLVEIKKDLSSGSPMNRLIQGDVGSGKTVVSFIAALIAIESGYQAAIMAPTEILAEQHYLTTHKYAESLGIKVTILTGGIKSQAKKKALEAIGKGDVDLVIGTHALIQKGVEFKRLGLAVVDEQHRFGVVQRVELKKKGAKTLSPHILVMTATPIPRTLSMTVFGDLDVSIIDELPKGRKPVLTKLLREKDRQAAYNMIEAEINSGAQAYIVYPLVETHEELSLKDATTMKERLEKEVFVKYKVGLIHGRMKSDEKESIMRAFKEKSIDILVSTTVIEVGVDVPNASIILIEHAERFGLAQLHQLRGRVGRGERPSICLLLAQYAANEDTWKRLKVLERTMDGFQIAEEDLKIRGPGDFIGTRQSGMPEFRTIDMLSDMSLLKAAREEAMGFLEKDPGLASAEGLKIKSVLMARWKGRLELAEIG
ncbi:MAG TPA: ATP-dependent DNA helicase RecG [Thermodesulfobacteriota bacterium]|nr:ATP-dependent DNA helicase RecG [Thermodesulfobacteriota bacterium]